MDQDYLPPLLRGIGTTIVLLATVFSVMVARRDVQTDRSAWSAQLAKAEAESKAAGVEKQNLAELRAEVQDLRGQVQEESVADEVIENPWFDWVGFIGMATVASSFFVESFAKKAKTTDSGI
jgi:hypothetical protein